MIKVIRFALGTDYYAWHGDVLSITEKPDFALTYAIIGVKKEEVAIYIKPT